LGKETGPGVAADGSSGSENVAIVALVFSACIIIFLLCSFRCRRCRWPAPMPWDVYRTVAVGQLRMVHPVRHAQDSSTLEITLLRPADFECLKSGETSLPLKALLDWVAQHPFMGFKGGIARLMAKLTWLDRGNPTLESEIQGFNDIDLIYFLREDEEDKKVAMKATVDQGLSIGGIPVEAQDVEYTFDTIPTVIATRDLTQNQCIVVSDDRGQVFLINSRVCHEHCRSGITAPASAPENCSLDENGNVIAAGRVVARAVVSWMRGRAQTVEFDSATKRFHQANKLSKTAQFQIFSKVKNNEQYMQAYTQLVSWGFLERQQYPHALWGECYAHVNSTIARHGYRLEPEGTLDSRAVEVWKEAKYAEQHARSRVNLFRDFRWHQMVLDTSYTAEYIIEECDLARSLYAHTVRASGYPSHISRDHLRYHQQHDGRAVRVSPDGFLQNPNGEASVTLAGATFRDTIISDQDSDLRSKLQQQVLTSSKDRTREIMTLIRTRGSLYTEDEASEQADTNEPILRQSLFGKLTVIETFGHILRLTKPAWKEFAIALALSCGAALLYIAVIKRLLGVLWLLVAAILSICSCIKFNGALNKALLHGLNSMFLALLNMQLETFTPRLFPEFWARLTGDSRALAMALKDVNNVFVEFLTTIGAGIALLLQNQKGCYTPRVSDAVSAVLTCAVLMLVTSLVSSLALRMRSRTVRSLVGYTYFHAFSALSRYFEMKALPEEWGAATTAYAETQEVNLEERKKLAVLEEVLLLFLHYVEIACLALIIPVFIEGIKTGPTGTCSDPYAVEAVALPVGLGALRRLCTGILALAAGVGSLERFFLLGQTALRSVATRFDGITTLGGDFKEVSLEVPGAFTLAVGGSPQFGPFAHIPALTASGLGSLNVMAMPRGSGATAFGKVLLRMLPAPARVLLSGRHIEQYEAVMLTWAIHVIDHAPFPSSVATVPGQGKTLLEYVGLGISREIGKPVTECLDRAGIRGKVMNIPFGVESTAWATVLSEPERYQVQLAQALFRASLGATKILVAIDPLRGCNAGEDMQRTRAVWVQALAPLLDNVLVLVIDQSGDAQAWREAERAVRQRSGSP